MKGNRLKSVIVDDEQNSIDALKILLSELRADIDVIGTASNANQAVKLISDNQPDIDLVFLDIQMPGGDGFSVLQRLGIIDFRVIFITAFDQFALKAIKFAALDYILKPVDPYELNEALNHFDKDKPVKEEATVMEFRKAITQGNYFDKLAVPTLTEVKFIPINDIIYLESDNNYSTLHLANKQKVIASKSIGYYEELLDPTQFFRIHNSYLVNLRKISSYIKGRGGYIALENGVQLEVSVRKKEELMKMLSVG